MSLVFAESGETRLSLAVYLVDSYTGAGGIAGAVSLEGHDVKPFRNPSGYYIFLDLPPGAYTVLADAGDDYLKCSKPADLSEGKAVALEVGLAPSPAYPFSPSDTLVRGSVRAYGVGVPGAVVSIAGTDIVSGTDDRGDFAVAFKGLKGLVVKTGGKSLVKVGGDDPSLLAKHPNYGAAPAKKTEVEEGKAATVTIIYP